MSASMGAALSEAAARLAAAGVPDAALDAEYLLAEVLHCPRLSLRLEKARALTEAQTQAYEALLSRREAREPLQYILGTQPFMGFSLRVDARALIPRNDTETLCEQALFRLRPGQRALDLCTGTGALAIAMKKRCPGAAIVATDISGDALSLARENAAALGAEVRFVQGDLFAPVAGERFELIVSNPPYIPEGLRGRLQAEVNREPELALFAGADGLDFYRRIAADAPGHLQAGGWLLLEIGDTQYDDVAALLAGAFTGVSLVRDMSGLPRVVVAQAAG